MNNKIRTCLNCKSEFEVRAPSVPNKYCSRECNRQSNIGRKLSEETKLKMSESRKGRIAWNKGIPHTDETKKKISDKGKERRLSEEHKKKIGIANSKRTWTEEMKEKHRGSNSNFWKGGISTEQNILRNSCEYKEWRKKVYSRDNYICTSCGSKKDLHAHHIKEFSKYKELRYEVSNGITLCRECHSEVHGRYIPNVKQLIKI